MTFVRRCKLAAAVLSSMLGAAVPAARAHAQAPEPASGERAQPLASPPRVLSLPPVEVAPDVALPPDGRVEVRVLVAADGSATIETCAASEAVCAQIEAAMHAARFRPAMRGDEPIASRVQLALALARAAEPAAAEPAAAQAAMPGRAPAAESSPYELSAQARIVPPQPGMRRLELAEMRDLPGAFGDPFRAVEVLPGIVPVLSGLPYFYVRGAPPAGTLYIYDDIPVPTLYHLAIGPAVIHPRMVGPIRLYSGVAPARYGRLTGGVVVGEGPELPDGNTHAEAELRLLDVSAYLQTPAFGGTLTSAVRYGYPGLLLSVFSPEVDLQYWDYELRYSGDRSQRVRFDLVALGSYDAIRFSKEPENDVTITFHRLEPRVIVRDGGTEYGAALLLGYDESTLGSEFSLRSMRVGPRAWLEHRYSDAVKLRLSGDLIGITGYFTSAQAADESGGQVRDKLVGDVPARSLWGLQAELGLRPSQRVELQLGARADAWLQGAGAEAVLDPRARVILHARPDLDLHVAGGVVHQPAVFYIPLPGIVDVAIDNGLQAAIQSEAGVGWDTPLDIRAELQLFLHHYDNLVFTDAITLRDSLEMVCETIGCPNGVEVPDRIGGYSYGAELFLRRPITQRLAGIVSYTLAWSSVDDVAGLPYTPTWDVRHVMNLVLQWNMGAGFSSGARFSLRSGKLHGEFVIDDQLKLARDERRMPMFERLDLELAYAWSTWWGRMRVALEWFNATLAREPAEIICTGQPRRCKVEYLPAIFLPNLGVRGEI
jgi:hypothetical protein